LRQRKKGIPSQLNKGWGEKGRSRLIFKRAFFFPPSHPTEVILLSISPWGSGVKEMKRGYAFLGGWVWEEKHNFKNGGRGKAPCIDLISIT